MHGGLPWGRENVTRPEGTQVRSIRSGMGVSIASDVKGPPPNRMADSVQYDPLEHNQRNNGALGRPTPFSDDGPTHDGPASSPPRRSRRSRGVAASARRDDREGSSWGVLPGGARLQRALIAVSDAILRDRLSTLRALLRLEPREDRFQEGVL